MKQYQCDKCKRIYYDLEITESKCSENFVGAYISTICPHCILKHELGTLKEIKEENK